MQNSYNYSKTSGSLRQYYRDEPFDGDNGDIIDFPADIYNSDSFKLKTMRAVRAGKDGIKKVKIRVPLKYLSNFLKTLEITLISCEVNLMLTQSAKCFVIDNPIASQEPFTISDTKLYVPVVSLSTRNNEKLFKQLKSGFRRTIN